MMNLFYKIKPQFFFIVVAVFCEILFNKVTPPLQAPDEISHFYRAYQIADGHFLPERTKDRLGGQIPVCFDEFVLPYTLAATNLKYTLSKEDVLRTDSVKFDAKTTQFKDFPSTTTYSPISYFPQIIGLYIAKHFDCTVSTLYYTGRLFSFIFWLLIMFSVIRILPLYKWLFTAIILLPMNLYVANAFSADGVNNCLTFLFMALVLKNIFSEGIMSKKDLFLILVILCSLALAKFVYVSFIVLLFLIPKEKFRNNLFRFGYIGAILAFAGVIVSYWSGIYLQNYIRIGEYNQDYIYNVGLSPCADPDAQKAYIMEHGFYFFNVIYHSIVDHPQTFLKGYIGSFGQADIPLQNWLYIMAFAVILFIALTECEKIILTIWQKIIIFLAAFSAFVLILLSIHLMWDCVGEGVVDLVQGRYLIPVFPLLFILFSNKRYKIRLPLFFLVLPLVATLYTYSAIAIYDRFYVPSFSSKTEFFCDFEQKEDQGFFLTSDPKMKLQGGTLVKDTCFNGKYSGKLFPPSQWGLEYGYNYQFKNLGRGDLLEIEAWEKGDSANIIIAGKAKNCDDFFLTSKKSSTVKNGWQKIYLVFTMVNKCDSTDLKFFLWNQSKGHVYFDNIKFSHKKFDDYLIE